VRHYFPNGLDAFWGAYLVAGTPDAVAAHYQGFVDAGIAYFVLQTLDPYDEETIALAASDLVQRLEPSAARPEGRGPLHPALRRPCLLDPSPAHQLEPRSRLHRLGAERRDRDPVSRLGVEQAVEFADHRMQGSVILGRGIRRRSSQRTSQRPSQERRILDV
jgi:hypothetical protein